ncbi:DHA2 family efflux MFS transporter permease subunit [Lacticaseibacillus zhaodongensis]|uniref:DHA2 family efflux MFS transporter permease subunit n=1 Tax=Lacticaseibacillus zhaodongensis TaxID=2668065 RepID=UPI0012D2B8DB|nr:DHA2 family efflux MFS transporter permease subunit [Lacticaseibacillus zhaodongensis]
MTTDRIEKRVVGAIFATGLLSFSGVIVETAMNITFPTVMREFNVTTSTVQWLTTLYLLIVATVIPLSAFLKRTFKMRRLFITANLLFILGLVLDGSAPAFWVLLLGRAVQGLGTGIALPLMFNIILEQVPQSKIGTMMGVGTLITGIAPAIGPTFGGLVTTFLSWRYIFVFLLPVLIISFVLGVRCIQQKEALQQGKLDVSGVLLLIVTFAGLIFGVSEISSGSIAPALVWVAIVVGLLALLLFVRRSRHQKRPILDLSPFGTTSFSQRALAFVMFQMLALGLSFVLPNYLQLVNGATALQAGLIVLPGAALGAALAPISGRLYDHMGPRRPILVGASIVLLGMFAFALLPMPLSNAEIICCYLVFMLGIGLAFGNILTDALGQLSALQQADGNAIMNTIQQFAAALGTAVSSALVASGQNGRSQIDGTALGSRWALWLLLGFSIIAWLILLRALRQHNKA